MIRDPSLDRRSHAERLGNVCRIHEYGEHGPWRYISMAFVEGVDLKRLLRQRGPLPPGEAFEAAIGVAEALQAIHEVGIVHRDLKTPNIMKDKKGGVKVMDFGIAKSLEGETSAGVTATGFIVGTPEYMSPEQARGEKVDIRSDLFSLGVVIFELFTGDVPFRAETPIATLMKLLRDPPPLDGPEAMRIPPALITVLQGALAKDPNERYESAAEMVQALDEARTQSGLGPRPMPVRPLTPIRAAAVPEVEPVTEPVATPVRTAVPTPVPTAVPTAVGRRMTGKRQTAVGTAGVPVEPAQAVLPVWLIALVVLAVVIAAGAGVTLALLRGRLPPPQAEARRNDKDGLDYAWILPGTFQMGCVPGDNECDSDEKPRHRVTLSRGLWLLQDGGDCGGVRALRERTGPLDAVGAEIQLCLGPEGPPDRERDLERREGVLRVVGRAAADGGRVGVRGAERARRDEVPVGRRDQPRAGELRAGGMLWRPRERPGPLGVHLARGVVRRQRVRPARHDRQRVGVVRGRVRRSVLRAVGRNGSEERLGRLGPRGAGRLVGQLPEGPSRLEPGLARARRQGRRLRPALCPGRESVIP